MSNAGLEGTEKRDNWLYKFLIVQFFNRSIRRFFNLSLFNASNLQIYFFPCLASISRAHPTGRPSGVQDLASVRGGLASCGTPVWPTPKVNWGGGGTVDIEGHWHDTPTSRTTNVRLSFRKLIVINRSSLPTTCPSWPETGVALLIPTGRFRDGLRGPAGDKTIKDCPVRETCQSHRTKPSNNLVCWSWNSVTDTIIFPMVGSQWRFKWVPNDRNDMAGLTSCWKD